MSQINPYSDKVVLSREDYTKLMSEYNRMWKMLEAVKWDLRVDAGALSTKNVESLTRDLNRIADLIQNLLQEM
jgi:hypothetical protein